MMMRLPALSIAARLHALFASLAALTVALAATAVVNARRHASLAGDFHAAFTGVQNVQRVNSLIYERVSVFRPEGTSAVGAGSHLALRYASARSLARERRLEMERQILTAGSRT